MNALRNSNRWTLRMLCVASLALATTANAFPPPANGVPVPELAQFDTIMQDFMDAGGIDAGVLGILRNDCIVYMKGFGWDNAAHTVLLSPDQMLRMASLTKPVVAAAAVLLDQQLGGTLLTSNAFNLGQAGGGVLNYAPWQALVDNRLRNVTVQHLIDHRGGWEKDEPGVPDWTYREVQVANAMGVASPPLRSRMVRFILGQPLQFNPGNNAYVDPNGNAPYSNINYLVLGLIIEQLSGKDLVTYIREDVYGQFPWVNPNDIELGRTFVANKHPREPHYHSFDMVTNVFDPNGAAVERPHGGWAQERRVGQGGLIASAAPLLVLANNHTIRGVPIDPTNSTRWTHTGSLPSGTASVLRRRGDGICFVVLFNRRSVSKGSPTFGSLIRTLIGDELDAGGITWPTECVDGTWVDFVGGSFFGNGTFLNSYLTMNQGINGVPATGNLLIKPGSSAWTGIISKAMTLRAPLGPVHIGQ